MPEVYINFIISVYWFEFLVIESFFKKKQLINYTIVLLSFPSGGFVDEVVNSQGNYQECWYNVYFLWCHTFAVIHSENGEGIC